MAGVECVLLLGPKRPEFVSYLTSRGLRVLNTENALPGEINLDEVDFLISFGYRHMINSELISRFKGRAINLHISYLPWNRGSDPNLWSYLENSPKGVTIHYLNEGLDTGDILVQIEVTGEADDTLKTSYDRLIRSITALFFQYWPAICSGHLPATRQSEGGSYHRLSDKEPFIDLLTDGWDTRVDLIAGQALR